MIKAESSMLRGLRIVTAVKLGRLYPAGTPEEVRERFEREWQRMRETGKTEEFYVFQGLAETVQRAGEPFNLRGPANASFLAYLLHDSAVNPMPAHRYCRCCGYYQEIPGAFFGLDAGTETCPCCGEPMRADGFSLPLETAWREGKGADLSEFSTARSPSMILLDLKRFYGNRVARMAEQVTDENDRLQYTMDGFTNRFVIFPEGQSPADHPDLTVRCDRKKVFYAPLEEMERRGIRQLKFARWRGYPLGGYAMMSLRGIRPMPELIERLSGKLVLPDLLAPQEVLHWGGEYKNTMAWKRMQEAPPATYFELAEAICCTHSTWVEKPEADRLPAFCSREALFHLLRRKEVPEKEAFRITEFIRKGRASDPAYREKWKQFLACYPALEGIRADAENCRYLWSQAAVLPTVMDAIACAGRKTV